MLYWLTLDALGAIVSASPHPNPRATEIRDGSDPELAAFLAPAPETPEQIQARLSAAIQKRLDDFARTRLYDGILSACTYAGSTIPKFAAEATYCIQARDDTWNEAYNILADAQAGIIPIPTQQELAGLLPVLAWPT